ncbi:MAG: exodeoxyribonuclease VII large subunit [Lachnospiraceae bacterium]|nr:exodeoxyribonuclease VII large subunit [Lachnospiraceae bacterium]
MKNAYSVGYINSFIKNMFAQEIILRSIYVKGEVSNVKYHSSGHIYFTMKDEKATLSCVMFSSSRKKLMFEMREGQQIIAGGRIDVYESTGKYQLYAEEIVLDGEGQLYERFEQLKKQLSEMGMFDKIYKKDIPQYIRTLGVVTAPTGAAVRDIINITKRRNPHVRMIIYPAQVQGEYAVRSIVNGIHALEDRGVDVMIVGRGGGSIEDLWAFNEEEVARAIFDCSVPVISAVGHETDTTIADFVADLRAPTPSAGAELAVYDYRAFEEKKRVLSHKFKEALYNVLNNKRNMYEQLKLKLINQSPDHKLREQKLMLSSYDDRLKGIIDKKIKECRMSLKPLLSGLNDNIKEKVTDKRHNLNIRIERIEAVSPVKRLSSGYVFAQNINNEPLISVDRVNVNDEVLLNFADGIVNTKVLNKRKYSEEEIIKKEVVE